MAWPCGSDSLKGEAPAVPGMMGGSRGGGRGGNREARRMIDRMGLDMNEVGGVREVLIRTETREMVIAKPSVVEMKGKDGTSIFTVTGECEERELETPVFSDEDVKLVAQQAGVDEERAKEALAESGGDLAQAILLLGG